VSQDVFERVEEIANNLLPDRWMLVGGLMVHAHAQLAGIQHARPTDDADLVVEARAGSYAGWISLRVSPTTYRSCLVLPGTGAG
jgi:hypothetical protein